MASKIDPNRLAERAQAVTQRAADVGTRVVIGTLFAAGGVLWGAGKQIVQTTYEVAKEQPALRKMGEALADDETPRLKEGGP